MFAGHVPLTYVPGPQFFPMMAPAPAKQSGGSGRGRQQTAVMRLAPPEVVAATRSLYADELKPFGRVLLKRLRERAAAAEARRRGVAVERVDPEAMPRIDPKRLRRLCEGCPQLVVEPEEGREYSVFVQGMASNFVDVCSPEDVYPAEMWAQARAYFEAVMEDAMMMPGGRYACARVLASRKLAFLSGYSLGQVCHIVQLAISQKKLLGYLDGQLVPFWASEEWVKERCAQVKQPVAFRWPAAGDRLPLASWDDARRCLRELLASDVGAEPGVISLSNVKRLFRMRFSLEFSETVLGFSRLYDLLQDPRLADTCCVQTTGNGQIVVRSASSRLAQPAPVGFVRRESEELTPASPAASAPSPAASSPAAAGPLRCLSTVPNRPSAARAAVAAAAAAAPQPAPAAAYSPWILPQPIGGSWPVAGGDGDYLSPGASPRTAAGMSPWAQGGPGNFNAALQAALQEQEGRDESCAASTDGTTHGSHDGSSTTEKEEPETSSMPLHSSPAPSHGRDELEAAASAAGGSLIELPPAMFGEGEVPVASSPSRGRGSIKNTFIDIDIQEGGEAASGSRRRCLSEPRAMGWDASWDAEAAEAGSALPSAALAMALQAHEARRGRAG